MTDKRVYNFSAGPSQLPVEVLKEAADQMLNYKGSGMSVMVKLQKKLLSLGMFILPMTVRTTILQKFLHRIS